MSLEYSVSAAADEALLSSLRDVFGADLVQRILQSKLLLVGAGGIGCEVLKNLALCGFCHVHVIDLDTIDVSNLNRQLLFRSSHVGQPKCDVACQVASSQLAVNSSSSSNNHATKPVSYTSCHGNVCDNEVLNVKFIAQFDLVINALDNVAARRRVNRLCLAASTDQKSLPLIEAGTTGYLGQVNVIDKIARVACYECQTQETQKVYPICTIRSTPSLPVHTIVWAKELYKLCFGELVEESMLYEDTNGADEGNVEEANHHDQNHDDSTTGSSVYMPAVLNYRESIKKDNDNTKASSDLAILPDAVAIITTIFVDEIKKQLAMDRYKTARKTPVALSLNDIVDACHADRIVQTQQTQDDDTYAVWSLLECITHLTACLVYRPSTVLPVFDKDDNFAMRFVTAASNLRSYVFQIEPILSFYHAKGIAGNIIPAIATTNAICAGLQMLQVFRILEYQLENQNVQKSLSENAINGHDNLAAQTPKHSLRDYCSYINCLRNPTRNGLYIMAAKLEPPNPNCFVCAKAVIQLSINVQHWKLQQFIDTILKKEMGFEQPTIMLGDDGDVIVWEEGEDADVDSFSSNLNKPISELPGNGICDGTSVHIEDFSQDLSVAIAVTNQTEWETSEDIVSDEDLKHKYLIGGRKPQVAATSPSIAVAANANAGDKVNTINLSSTTVDVSANDAMLNDNVDNGDDDDNNSVMEVFDAPAPSADGGVKRKASINGMENGDDQPVKKAKRSAEVIEID